MGHGFLVEEVTCQNGCLSIKDVNDRFLYASSPTGLRHRDLKCDLTGRMQASVQSSLIHKALEWMRTGIYRVIMKI